MPDLTMDDLLYRAITALKAKQDLAGTTVATAIEATMQTDEYIDAEESDNEEAMCSLAISSLREVANRCLQVVALIT